MEFPFASARLARHEPAGNPCWDSNVRFDPLGLSPAPDRLTEILVTKIIDLCLPGEFDSDRLSEIVVAYFRAGARMPDSQAKQKLLELAGAWEELAREALEPT
jgi:hypothetical protein